MGRDAQLYYWMRLTRAFEERVSALHRQGKILGGVYSGIGQEAVSVGTAAALAPEDLVFPLHRDLGVFLVRGVDPKVLMAQLFGKRSGLSKGKDSFLHAGALDKGVFGSTSMLGASLPVAVGAALSLRLQRRPGVALAYFGEGASSRGDVHEAMNFAGVHRLPVLFVCVNNGYAYSTPAELQFAIDDIADRAAGYGFRGRVCSGNDLHAVEDAVERALARARAGEGPTLIECKTYRWHGHSEIDAATYRDRDEVIEWRSRDPIARWEVFLRNKHGEAAARIRAEVEAKVASAVDEAVRFAEESPLPDGREALEDLYATVIRGKAWRDMPEPELESDHDHEAEPRGGVH